MINTSEDEGAVVVHEDLNPYGPSRVPEGEVYRPDRLNRKATLAAIMGAAILAFAFALVLWMGLKQTNLPAFGPSNVTRAVASATIAAVLIVTGFLTWLWLRDEH